MRDRKLIERTNIAGSAVTLAISIWLLRIVGGGEILRTSRGFFYADGLSAYLIAIVSLIGFAVSLSSPGYLRNESEEKHITVGDIRRYFAVFHVFVFTMLLVPLSNNLGFLWIAVEGTTLASAFLVGFYDDEASIEAAWKYLIICSVGIALALFGTILMYFSALQTAGRSGDALQWSYLITVAKQLDPNIVKMSFVFILVGYGTKAGLAPMHAWLPDAHSQAPTPISALLSGVLLNSALYALLRFNLIISQCVGGAFSGTLLIIFGILSIAVASPFILMQRNYKRLLAYSSIEQVGIIAFGFGLGTPLALYGALLHMLNNALAKSMLFFSAGNIVQRYHTKTIHRVSGVIRIMPVTGIVFLLGIFCVTGWPPFGLFISEFTIITAGFASGNIFPTALLLLFTTVVFFGFIYYGAKMVMNVPHGEVPRGGESRMSTGILISVLVLLVVLGVYIPPGLHGFLQSIVTSIQR